MTLRERLSNVRLPHDMWTEIFCRLDLHMPMDKYSGEDREEQVYHLAREANMIKVWKPCMEKHWKWWKKHIPNGVNILSYLGPLSWAIEHDCILFPYRTKKEMTEFADFFKHPSIGGGGIGTPVRWTHRAEMQWELHKGVMEMCGGGDMWEKNLPKMKHYFLAYFCPVCKGLHWAGTSIGDASKPREKCHWCKVKAQIGKDVGERITFNARCPKCEVRQNCVPIEVRKANGTRCEGSLICSVCNTLILHFNFRPTKEVK